MIKETRFRQASNMVSRKVGEEVILVPIRQNMADLQSIYTLNDSGSVIWGMLDGQRTLGDIISELNTLYDTDDKRVETTVFNFVGQLESIGAVLTV